MAVLLRGIFSQCKVMPGRKCDAERCNAMNAFTIQVKKESDGL